MRVQTSITMCMKCPKLVNALLASQEKGKLICVAKNIFNMVIDESVSFFDVKYGKEEMRRQDRTVHLDFSKIVIRLIGIDKKVIMEKDSTPELLLAEVA